MKAVTVEHKRIEALIPKSSGIDRMIEFLKESKDVKKLNKTKGYVMKVEVVDGYQVFRYFYYVVRKKSRELMRFEENFRFYINVETLSINLVARRYNPMFTWRAEYPVFSSGSVLEVRRLRKKNFDYTVDHRYSYMYVDDVLVDKIHKNIRKYGVTKRIVKGIMIRDLFNCLTGKDSVRYETLIKCFPINVAGKFIVDEKINDSVYTALKICKRNNYKAALANFTEYYDYITNLDTLGKDFHNPKYACPDNLKKAHDESVVMVENKRERERKEAERLRLVKQLRESTKDNARYIERIKNVSSMVIDIADGIKAVVLQDVESFKQEADYFHHCVFASKYYNKTDSLVLSARDSDGNRIETIEVCIKTGTVLQCHGMCNGSTKYHDVIVNTINERFKIEYNRCIAMSKRKAAV